MTKDLLLGFVKGTSHDEVKLKAILDYISNLLFNSNDEEEGIKKSELAQNKV